MHRVYDPIIIRAALDRYPFDAIELDIEDWLRNPVIILSDDDDNLGLFEEYFHGVWTGHYFFKTRGKAAKDLSIKMLREIFEVYGAKAVRGLTPIEHKAALWMARHLGFKSYGELDTSAGKCVLFVMTKDEFKEKHNE